MGKPGTSTRRAAAEISARVRSVCRRLLLSILASCALLVVLGITAVQAGLARYWLLAIAVLALPPGWSVWAFLRARPPTEPVLKLGQEEQPLRDLCDDVARSVSVAPVRRVALSSRPRTRLHTNAGGVRLLVGAPALWHLREREMRAGLAPVIASSPIACQGRMRWAARLGGRMLRAYGAAPAALGWLVRGATEDLRRALAQMEHDLEEWGRVRAAEHGLTQEPESEVLEEAWEVFVDTFAMPGYRRSRVPIQMGSGLHDFMVALDSCGVIDRRKSRQPSGSRVIDLFEDPSALDRRVSHLVAARLGVHGQDVEWSQYPAAVVEPHQRELAGKLVSAVGLVKGKPVEPTMVDVIEAVEENKQEVAAALYGHTSGDSDDAAEDPATKVLEEHLVAFVTTAVVDAGRATRELDWVTGHLVLTGEREVMDVSGVVASFMHETNPRLYAWMEWLGLLRTAVRVNAGDPETAEVFATGVCGPVLLRGAVADLVRYGEELLVLGDVRSFGWRRLADVLAGRRWVIEQLRRNRTTPVEQLLRENPSSVRMPLTEISQVQLTAGRFTRLWKCVFDLPGRRVVVRGNLDLQMVARVLRAELGERVRTRRVPTAAPTPGRHAHRGAGGTAGASSAKAPATIRRRISGAPSKMVVNRASRQ